MRDWAVLIGSDRDREVKVMWAHAGRDRMMGCLFALFVGCSPRLRTAPSWVKRAAESSDTSRPSDGRSDPPRVLGGVVPGRCLSYRPIVAEGRSAGYRRAALYRPGPWWCAR